MSADKKRQAQEEARLSTVEETTLQGDALSTQSKPEHDVNLTDSSDADDGGHQETGPTPTQAEAVQQVLACRSNQYRKILDVESEQADARAEKESVVNSFRKRGCLTHPDYNSTPGAEKAFKSMYHCHCKVLR